MHYGRLRKRGSIGPAERRNVMPGTGSIDAYGYVIRHDPAHPLARAQGKVPEHRAVLYDTIGPQPQPCHWCGQVLMWTAESQGDRICVDHLDWNRQNNDPANLVPACLQCNAQRVEVFA